MKNKNYVKGIISLLSAFCILISMIPVSVSAADSPASGWTVQSIGGYEADFYIDASTSFDGRQSLKMHCDTPKKSGAYVLFSTNVPVKRGRTYKFSFARKGEKIDGTANYCIDWGKRYVFKDMYGSNFDWKTKSFLWTNNKGDRNVAIQFIIDSTFDGIWIDDFEFVEWDGEVVGKNLISNPSFENDKAKIFESENVSNNVKVDISKVNGTEAVYNALKSTDSFGVEKYEEAMPLLSTLPLYKKDNIKIDADGSEWNDIYSVHLPVKKTQYRVYNNESEPELEMDYKAAYDDDNFYLYIECYDDKLVTDYSTAYWQNDSIQIAMGDMSEAYGDEVGLMYEEDGGFFTSNSWRFEEIAKIKLKTARAKDKIIYEVAIPWGVHFGERPKDNFVFSILAADNDGAGRDYTLEMTPGISSGKTNAEFVTYNLMQENEEFYSDIEKIGNMYSVYVVNTSDEDKKYKINSQILGLDTEIELKPGDGARVVSNNPPFEMGKNIISVDIFDGNVTRTITKMLDVNPDDETMNNLYEDYAEKVKELQRLVQICKMLEIPTDYEESRIWVINQFIEYFEDDFKSEHYNPIAFGRKNLEDIYTETKANLEAYIAKEKEARKVPIVKTGKIEIDGQSLVADVLVDGKIERRPSYYIGYGHFYEVQRDIPLFENISATAHAVSIYSGNVVPHFSEEVDNYLAGWISYGIEGMTGINAEQKEVDGSKGKAFVISNSSERIPSKYAYWYQSTEGLRRGESYILKFRAKAKNATGCNMVINGVSGHRISLDGSYDWKDFEYEIVMKDTQTRLQWGIFCENLTEELIIDSVTICKKDEPQRSLIVNGEFENGYKIVDKYAVDTAVIAHFGEILDELARYNQNTDALISPASFPAKFLPAEALTLSGGFFKFDITNPELRKILKIAITETVTPYKDHPALKSVVLMNEPTLTPKQAGDAYIDEYREWLKNFYNNDIGKLNSNHKTAYITFDEIGWPEDFTEAYYDYVKFNNEIFNEYHQYLADCVKEAAPDLYVTAKPMDYNTATDSGSKRNYHSYGTDMTLFKNWMDINGCDSWAYYNSTSNDSMQTKMQWYDFMRSVKKVPSSNTEDHIIKDGNLDFVPQQAKWMETDLWQGAIHGRVTTNIWLWDSDRENTPAAGSIRFRPDCIVAASDVAKDLNRLCYEATALQTKKSDVGLLYSIASRNYNSAWMNAMFNSWNALTYNGMKVEYITEDQLDKMFEFPMLIVAENYNVPEATAKKVLEYAKSGGKVIMLGEDSLKYDEYNNPISIYEEIKALSQIVPVENRNELVISPGFEEYKKLVGEELSKLGLKKVRLINTQTGEEPANIEYSYAQYNGKLLLNLCQYEWNKSADYYVEVDGNIAKEIRELRSAEDVDDGIVKVTEYKPLLLEIEI